MTTSNPREVIEQWSKALNRRDAPSVAELYHDDAEKVPMATGKPLLGKPAIRDFLRGFFRAFPDLGMTIESVFEVGEWVVVEWTRTGTWLNDFGGRSSTGKGFVLRGCAVFRIVEGKIKTHRVYLDRATWFGQIGMTMS